MMTDDENLCEASVHRRTVRGSRAICRMLQSGINPLYGDCSEHRFHVARWQARLFKGETFLPELIRPVSVQRIQSADDVRHALCRHSLR